MGLNKQRLASVSDAFLMRYGCEVTIPRDSSLSPRSRLSGPSTALFKSIECGYASSEVFSVVINLVQHISSPNHSSPFGSEIYISLESPFSCFMAPPSTALSRCITLDRSQLISHCTPPCFLHTHISTQMGPSELTWFCHHVYRRHCIRI